MAEQFNKSVVRDFLVATFSIVVIFAGFLIIMGRFGFQVQALGSQIWLNIPFVIYVCSPAVACYLVLKKHGYVSNFGAWLKNILNFRAKFSHYLLVIIGILIYYSGAIIVSTEVEIWPMWWLVIFMPISLFLGGLEEAGWMYILQPKLDVKYGFLFSSILVGTVWIIWHIPLFFIPGTAHYAGFIPFGVFAFNNIFGRFIYGTIHRVSGNVFLSILFHTLYNATSNVFIVSRNWRSEVVAVLALCILSLSVVWIDNRVKFKRAR